MDSVRKRAASLGKRRFRFQTQNGSDLEASATTAATASVFTWTSFIDDDLTTVQLGTIECFNGFISSCIHLHEAKPAGTARFSVTNDLGRCHDTKLSESLLQSF